MMMSNNNTNKSGSAEEGVTTARNIARGTTFSLEASAIILFNLLTIITFTINRHLRKRSMYCVINLAVADMLFGIEETLSEVLMWKIQDHTGIGYLVRIAVRTVVGFGTIFSLALVAVERMCATVWPVRHRNARPRVYTLAISMTWTAAAMGVPVTGAGIMSTMPHQTAFRILITIGAIIIVGVVGVICVSYLVIFIKVKQQQKQMAGQRISRQDQRLVMTLFIVTVASIGTWIPLALVWLLSIWDVIFVPSEVILVVLLIAFSNSLINPIIYVFRMRDFRKALFRLLLRCERDRPTLVVPQPIQQLDALNITSVTRRTELSQVENQTNNKLH